MADRGVVLIASKAPPGYAGGNERALAENEEQKELPNKSRSGLPTTQLPKKGSSN